MVNHCFKYRFTLVLMALALACALPHAAHAEATLHFGPADTGTQTQQTYDFTGTSDNADSFGYRAELMFHPENDSSWEVGPYIQYWDAPHAGTQAAATSEWLESSSHIKAGIALRFSF